MTLLLEKSPARRGGGVEWERARVERVRFMIGLMTCINIQIIYCYDGIKEL